MPEIDVNNMPCPFCHSRFEFVMVVFGPWTADTVGQKAGASVDFVECPCGAKFTKGKGWQKQVTVGTTETTVTIEVD